MGGLFSNPEEIELRWCSEKNKTCAQCIANNLTVGPPANTILYQLVRFSVGFGSGQFGEEIHRLSWRTQFAQAVKLALPSTNPTSRSLWIVHYSPCVLVVGAKDRRRGYITIDRTAICLFFEPHGPGICCGGGDTVNNFAELRIPLTSIKQVSNQDDGDWYIVASLRVNSSNPLKWKHHKQVLDREIHFNTSRKNELLRELRGVMNVLTFGEPATAKTCEWQNMPEGVMSTGDIVPEEYLDHRDSGCFDAKLLTHALSNSTADEAPEVPECWLATTPPMLHSYSAFYQPAFGSKKAVPASPTQLYEVEFSASVWSDISPSRRLSEHCPPLKLPGFVDAFNHRLSGFATGQSSGVVNMAQLHGSDYLRSSHTSTPVTVAYPRGPLGRMNPLTGKCEAGYAVCSDGSILGGDVRWYGPAAKDSRLISNARVVLAALKAIRHSKGIHTLSFDGCALPTAELHLEVLTTMVDLCRCNKTLVSIAFPFSHATADAKLLPKFRATWKEISDALCANPQPKFTSLDLRGCNLDDDGLANLLPGLESLFGPTRHALRPVSLRLDSNGLTPAGVTRLCNFLASVPNLDNFQELSLAGNPWTSVGSTTAVLEVVKKSPALKMVNFEGFEGRFINVRQLEVVLVASPCPLEVLALGGSRVPPHEMLEWEQAVTAIAQAKNSTLKKLSLRCLALDPGFACRLISALPAVEVDLSDGGIGGVYPGPGEHINPQALITGLSLSKNAWVGLQIWKALPRHIVDLDLSEVQGGTTPQVFSPLLHVFRTLQCAVALLKLSVARNVAVADLPIFQQFLESVLGNEFLKLKSLDISGCRSGESGLTTLGRCLRKNRTLTALNVDGQAFPGLDMNAVGGLPTGWQALRGCFYGNKKIVELSYPWADVAQYFRAVALAVEAGWNQAAVIKQQIGAAHRANQMYAKQQRINDIIACKGAFKRVERVRTKTVTTLHDIYTAVQVNAALAAANQRSKLEGKRSTPSAEGVRVKLSAKEFKLIGALHTHLSKLARTHAKATHSSTTARTAAPSSNGHSDSPAPPPIPSEEETVWADISAAFALGPLLFTPNKFRSFVMLIESVGGRNDAKLGRSLQTADGLIGHVTAKGAALGRSPEEYSADLLAASSSLFDQYKNVNFWQDALEYLAATAKKPKRKEEEDEGDAADGDDGDEGEEPAGPQDEAPSGPLDDGPLLDNPSDYLPVPRHSEEGGNNSAPDGIPDIVALYAGAGPRDLPDGGDNHDRFVDPVASGSRARQHGWNDKYMWNSAQAHSLPPAVAAPSAGRSASQVVREIKRQWQSAIEGVIANCSSLLLNALEYKVISPYLSTKSSVASECTLVTQCSVDRLGKLERLVRGWGGAVSVAVYISTEKNTEKTIALAAVDDLVQRLDGDASFQGHLTVSVLFGHEDTPWLWDCSVPGGADGPLYPINALRNLAAAAVLKPKGNRPTSPLVFLVDVDFAPSIGLGEWVQQNAVSALLPRCQRGDLIVVPAFECDEALSSYLAHPTVDFVFDGMASGSITGFHVSHFPAGHSPSDYSRWQDLSASPASQAEQGQQQMYKVPYSDYYEPYVIMSTERFVPYDERFRGYGLNKCIHLRALAERGCTFHVLPGHFVVAEGHAKSVAHLRTYGSQSGYRKHVVAAAYRAALRDIKAGVLPAVSGTTQHLLSGTDQAARKMMKHKVKGMVRKVGEELKDMLAGSAPVVADVVH